MRRHRTPTNYSRNQLAKALNARLDTEIGQPEPGRIALAVPGECRDGFEFAESFKVTLAGSSEMYDELDASQLVAAVRNKPAGDRLAALRAGRVEMFADTDGAQLLSRKIPADQWLTAEVSEGIVHYFCWQGRWYEIGAEYLATVESRITEFLARPASVTLPPWTKSARGGEDHDEDWYNKEIAKQDGYVLLDKDTVRTRRLRGGGLEIADALGPSGQFVCVKKADSTAPLNHLFAQGRVPIETLRYDLEAREKFLAKLQQLAPGHSLDTSFSTPVLVLGIMLKDGIQVTVNSLSHSPRFRCSTWRRWWRAWARAWRSCRSPGPSRPARARRGRKRRCPDTAESNLRADVHDVWNKRLLSSDHLAPGSSERR